MAVKALHEANIIHRDIKPANFFLMINGGFKLGLVITFLRFYYKKKR